MSCPSTANKANQMKHNSHDSPVCLETSRLILKMLSLSNLNDLIQLRTHPDVMRYIRVPVRTPPNVHINLFNINKNKIYRYQFFDDTANLFNKVIRHCCSCSVRAQKKFSSIFSICGTSLLIKVFPCSVSKDVFARVSVSCSVR